MAEISPITDKQFNTFKDLIYDMAGISMAPAKKALVAGRLVKRLKHYGLSDYGQYYSLVNSPQYPGELQVMVDLLTTNETYFFREHQHFEFLVKNVLATHGNKPLRIWSAACSSGEEVYTLAMVLAKYAKTNDWEVLGSDISARMIEACRRAVYPMSRGTHIPAEMMSKYCLKGVRSQDGMFLVDRQLRARCKFQQVNLMKPLPSMGRFDVIFVRNVMIYFDLPTRKQVIDRLLGVLNPGGIVFTSHSESLHNVSDRVQSIKPSIYRKK